MKEDDIKWVHYERRPGDPLSDESWRQLEALASMPDEAIDFSDIPKLKTEAFENAQRFHDAAQPGKRLIAVPLDGDVLAWLQTSGPGYEARVNEMIRERMLAEHGGDRKTA